MKKNTEVKKAIFQEFNNKNNVHKNNKQDNNIDILKELEVDFTVEFASRKIKMNDVLNLKLGEVINLNKEVNEPLKILVNGKEIAKGEVVVMEEEFGIRITEIKGGNKLNGK